MISTFKQDVVGHSMPLLWLQVEKSQVIDQKKKKNPKIPSLKISDSYIINKD